ncbi:MAG: hypothetical protein V3V11_06520 [Vicinamibacteria bacterium]
MSTRAEVRVERCLTVQALDHWKLKFAQLDQPPQPWVFRARSPVSDLGLFLEPLVS